MFYLIMKNDGTARRWWNADDERWGTRAAATRYVRIHDSILPPNSRWVGPCDGSE